jgi:hypothetical protein
MEKIRILDSGSAINIPDHIFKSLVNLIWVKNAKFFVANPVPDLAPF